MFGKHAARIVVLLTSLLLSAGTVRASPGEADLVLIADSPIVFRVDGSQVIGRSRACSLLLEGTPAALRKQLSRLHALLQYDRGTWSLTDLASLNGTRVNGRRLTPGVAAPLAPGDKVTLGALEFKFRVPASGAATRARFDPLAAQRLCTPASPADCAVLAVAFRHGLGLAKDPGRATQLLQQACGSKFETACRLLAAP